MYYLYLIILLFIIIVFIYKYTYDNHMIIDTDNKKVCSVLYNTYNIYNKTYVLLLQHIYYNTHYITHIYNKVLKWIV